MAQANYKCKQAKGTPWHAPITHPGRCKVVGDQHAPAALPPGKSQYQLFRRPGGPRDRYRRARKVSPPPPPVGFDPPAVQPPMYISTACNAFTF